MGHTQRKENGETVIENGNGIYFILKQKQNEFNSHKRILTCSQRTKKEPSVYFSLGKYTCHILFWLSYSHEMSLLLPAVRLCKLRLVLRVEMGRNRL